MDRFLEKLVRRLRPQMVLQCYLLHKDIILPGHVYVTIYVYVLVRSIYVSFMWYVDG